MSQHPSPPSSALDTQGLPRSYPYQPDWEITPRQVKALRDAGQELILIDCRTPQECRICKIQGAELIPLQEMAKHRQRLGEIKDKPVVIHCHHGGRSMQMARLLRQEGFGNVRSMAGGIDLWALDIEPGMTHY